MVARADGPRWSAVSLLAVSLILVSAGVSALADVEPPIPGGAIGASEESEDQRSREYTIDSFDGAALQATLWYDANRTPEPRGVVLAAHGWSQDRHHMEPIARWLVDEGYHVLAWDARGFGESEGTVGLNGPNEWADVTALIDWLTETEGLPDDVEVRMDEPDDPRLGMVGGSYGGAIQLLAAAQDDRIDAIVPDITWNDLAHSLAPDDVVKRGWVDLLYTSGQAASHGLMSEQPGPNAGGMDERLTQWFAEALATGRLPEDAVEPFAERSPKSHTDTIQAHTLLTQGWYDTLFPPDEANATYNALKDRDGPETHLVFYLGGHGHSIHDDDIETYLGLVAQFFERHLQDADVDALPPVIAQESAQSNWTHLDRWPPSARHAASQDLAAENGAGTVTLAITPAPTSHTDTQQFAGDYPVLAGDLLDQGPLPTATRLESGMDGPFTLHGNPVVQIAVTPESADVTLFFSLIETSGDQDKVLYNQVTPVRVEGSSGSLTELDVRLPSLAHTVSGGKSLQLRVTTSDTGYHSARSAGTVELDLQDARLMLPLVGPEGIRAVQPEGELDKQDAPGPAVLLVLAAVGIVLYGASRRRSSLQ